MMNIAHHAPLPPDPLAIVIRLNGTETGEQLAKRLNTQRSFQPIRGNEGVHTYQLHWDNDPLKPNLRFEHGEHSFTVPNLLSLVTQTGDTPIIRDYDLSFVLAPTYRPHLHETARLYIMNLLAMLQRAGWRQYYGRSSARYLGRSALLAKATLDARYVLTPEEWFDLGARMDFHVTLGQPGDGQLANWALYANGIYMTIHAQRQVDKGMPKGMGAYLFSMQLQNEMMEIQANIGNYSGRDWKPAWAEFVALAPPERKKDETEALAKGYKIDVNYRDPPILALQKPVLSVRGNQTCPKSGWWRASTTDSKYWVPSVIAKHPLERVEQGKSMPSLGTPSDTPAQRAAGNASIVWTWVKE